MQTLNDITQAHDKHPYISSQIHLNENADTWMASQLTNDSVAASLRLPTYLYNTRNAYASCHKQHMHKIEQWRDVSSGKSGGVGPQRTAGGNLIDSSGLHRSTNTLA